MPWVAGERRAQRGNRMKRVPSEFKNKCDYLNNPCDMEAEPDTENLKRTDL